MNEELEVRYFVEHEMIPNTLFRYKGHFMDSVLKEKGSLLIDMYNSIKQEKPDYVCPYTASDFNVTPYVFVDEASGANCCIVKVQMPKPENTPLCTRVYLCYDETMEHIGYCTIERSFEDKYLLCGWTSSQIHLNCGETPDNIDEELKAVMRYYLESEKLEMQ